MSQHAKRVSRGRITTPLSSMLAANGAHAYPFGQWRQENPLSHSRGRRFEDAPGKDPGKSGTVKLFVDGRPAGSGKIEKTTPFKYSLSEIRMSASTGHAGHLRLHDTVHLRRHPERCRGRV